MKAIRNKLADDSGVALVAALLVLVLLTIAGISAISTSSFESQVIGNEHRYQIDFYVADSGWREAAIWLDNSGGPPASVNANGDNVVKNFGSGTPAATGATDPTPTIDDAPAPDNSTLSSHGVPYWYQVTYLEPPLTVPGSGAGYWEFRYLARSNANRTQEVDVNLSKVFKTGYK